MPTTGKKAQIYRIKKFWPVNRIQEQRIENPRITYRPLRMERRDVVQRGKLKQAPDWWSMHRRGPGGMPKTFTDDPNEMRAVPKSVVKGTLPERIIYAELLKRQYVPGIDFTFQSSREGGRTELGGIVVDFLFEFHRIALEVQGPTHDTVIGKARDREKANTMASMGFTVIPISTDVIDSPMQLEMWFRQHLDWGVVSILDPFETYTDEVGGGG
jgi:very-short-patch-repair endonuclease